MNYWIFQSYKFERPSRLPHTIAWRASRYREDMKEGDLVYLWLSGEEKGVRGWGHLTSVPKVREDGTWAVNYQLETWLENPVEASAIKAPQPLKDLQPEEALQRQKDLQLLKGLLILKMAVGTNFSISREEAQAIAAQIEPETDRPKVE